MAEASQQSESMEEILQSIKRIIEDDSGVESKPASPAEDIFDLTAIVKEDGSIDTLPPPPRIMEDAPPTPPAQQSIDDMFASIPQIAEEEKFTPYDTDMLVSEATSQAAISALRPIVENSAKDLSIPNIPSPKLRNGNNVEDLVLEALRPMLKDWLDVNLPTLVERIVEKEVKRIVNFHYN